MANALSGVFDRIGDTVDSLTGKTNKDLYRQSLDQQSKLNEQLFDLERERQERLNSPEYRKQQNIKLAVVAFIFAAVLFVSYKMLVK